MMVSRQPLGMLGKSLPCIVSAPPISPLGPLAAATLRARRRRERPPSWRRAAAGACVGVLALREARGRTSRIARAGDAGEAGATRSPPPRRRRRRKQPSAGLGGDLQLASKQEVTCDCDRILGTVVEMDGLLTDQQCELLIDAACRRASVVGWAVERHQNYTTQDVKIWNLNSPVAIEVFRECLAEPMRTTIAQSYGLPRSSVQVDDGFVVRYAVGAQTSLKFHRDGSIVSGIVSLSASDEYSGGGTAFIDGASYRPEKGCGILFGGQRRHSGVEITRGERFICTLFFRCGELSCRDQAVAKEQQGGGDLLSQIGSMFGF